MTQDHATREELSARLSRMEAVQTDHLRRCMFLLLYFTVAFASLAWEWLKRFSLGLEALPIATVVVICVWVYYVSKHSRELSDLRKSSLAQPDLSAGVNEACTAAVQPSTVQDQEPSGI